MKPSHLQTPRSLNECSFTHGYVPGPAHTRGKLWVYPVVVALCVAAALVWVAAPFKG